MSQPMSYASHALNLDKNQAMPAQARAVGGQASAAAAAKPAKAKKETQVAAASTDAAAAAAPAKAPAAGAKAPAKAAAPANGKPAAGAAPTSPAGKQAGSSAGAPKSSKKDEVSSPRPATASSASFAAASSSSAEGGDGEGTSRAAPKYKTGFAMVKAVLSGDTLLLSSGGNDRTITLSGVQAPKFGRGKAAEDEPWAWESREYLRKHVIGQQVSFTIQHTHATGRDYGTVQCKGVDVCEQMIKTGWVKVKTNPGKDGKLHPEKEEALAVEAAAAARGLGMHRKGADPNAHLRTIDWEPNTAALFQANKGTPINGVVDQVRDGSTLRIELIHPNAPLKHTMITLFLAGVACNRTPLPLEVLVKQWEAKKAADPTYKEKKPTSKPAAEPMSEEAQKFTETRLLNRDVQVILQGVDKTGNLFGSVVFAKGNITLKLLQEGYGKLVPWSAALTPKPDELKAAEDAAKAAHKGVWRDYKGSAAEAASSSSSSSAPRLEEFTGKVVSIPSSDSIVVEDPSGAEVRVWLASVRAPRFATRGGKVDKEGAGGDEPFAIEAKEFLRSKLIGHKVRVVPEYARSAPQGGSLPDRQFATVFQNKTNINEALIASGFAEVIPHGMKEDRSQFYDVYLAAEAQAKAAKRGLHDEREHVATRIVDLTERVKLPKKKAAKKPKKDAAAADGAEADAEEEGEKKEGDKKKEDKPAPSKAELEAQQKNKQLAVKAAQYFIQLKREPQNATVEYVFSASRFKLLVPKEHVMISFSLGGIRTPNPTTDDGQPNPLNTEVLNYVRSKIQQHSVKIEVENQDKSGNFLGALFFNRVNLAVDLLQQGYASIFGFAAAKSKYAKELYQAERQAKEARKGQWVNWVEPTPEEKAAAAAASGGADYEDESKDASSSAGPLGEKIARITEIVDCTDFFVQWVGDKNVEAVDKALAEVAAQPESDKPFAAPSNANGRSFIAAGQFSDDTWHRVRCDGQDEDGNWRVYFIDYGNHDTLPADRLRLLPEGAAKIPPLAVHCALAGLTAPRAPEYQEGSALAFSEMAFGIDLKATIEFTDKFNRKHLTLSHESHPISVNRQLLRDGWARVQTRPDRRISKLIHELNEEEKYAKDHHYNLFEYGDVSDEEEGEKVLGPDPKARPNKRPPTAGGKK